MDRASARWRTKRTAASQPSFPARSPNSLTCRAPLSVTASGKRATPSFTRVTLFTSRTSCLPSSRDSRKSKRDLPMVTSDRSSFHPPNSDIASTDSARPMSRLESVVSREISPSPSGAWTRTADHLVLLAADAALWSQIDVPGTRSSHRRPGSGRCASCGPPPSKGSAMTKKRLGRSTKRASRRGPLIGSNGSARVMESTPSLSSCFTQAAEVAAMLRALCSFSRFDDRAVTGRRYRCSTELQAVLRV